MSSNITYLKNEDGELCVVKYEGDDEVVVIPETVEGIPVKRIGLQKRMTVKDLESIGVFNSNEFEYMRPFASNSSIKEIVIPDTVEEINSFVFDRCINLETVKLPKNLKEIPMYCFGFCENLKNIELPDGIERIENHAFERCTGLENIKLPESLDSISECAFMSCFELKDINFPKNLKNIGKSAFNYCKNLAEVHLLENIENIGGMAFKYCFNLEKIIIDNPKVKAGKNAFSVYENLKEVNFNALKCLEVADQPKFLKEYITNWDTTENQKEVLLHISKKKTLQKEIFMGDDVEMANFLIRLKLKINLSDLNKYLDKAIKEEHTGLTAVFLEYKENNFSRETIKGNEDYDELVEIGLEYPTFAKLKEKWKCSKVPNGIRISAYKGSSDKEVIPKQLSDGTPIVLVSGSGSNAYKGLTTIIIEDGILEIGDKAFYDCKDLEQVEIPKSVQAIGKQAFAYSGITQIDLPDGLKIINHGTFTKCRKLEKIVLPDSVEKIDSMYMSPTFEGCARLQEVVLPRGLDTIGNSAFYECIALETIKNTENISKIDSYAFFGCTKLERFKLNNVKIGTNSFWDCKKWANNIGLVIINDAVIDTLDQLPQEIEVPSNVKIIGEEAFKSRTCVHRIVLPDGLLEIEKRAFARCMNLCEINIPSSVKVIRPNAFSNTKSLEQIEVPQGTKITNAFEECDAVVNRV